MSRVLSAPGERSGGMFGRVALWIAVGFFALLMLFGSFAVRERLVAEAAGFATSVIDRTLLISRLTNADPALLRRLSDSRFEIQLQQAAPESPPRRDRWTREDDVRALVDRHLRALNIDPAGVPMWFDIVRGVPRLTIALPQENSSRWIVVDASAPAHDHATSLLRHDRHALSLGARVHRRAVGHASRHASSAASGAGRGSARARQQHRTVAGRGSEGNSSRKPCVQSHAHPRPRTRGAAQRHARRVFPRHPHPGPRAWVCAWSASTDAEQRDKADADLAAITRIVEEAMAYSQDEVSDEPLVDVDLRSLLGALLGRCRRCPAVPLGACTPWPNWMVRTRSRCAVRPSHCGARFANLIDNALLYGGDVRVSLRADSPGRDSRTIPGALVCISDSGPGIPEADRERVLAPYVRLEGSRNRETGGTGLGLAIVNNVIARHHGALSFARGRRRLSCAGILAVIATLMEASHVSGNESF